MENLRLYQHYSPGVSPENARYQDIDITRAWLEKIGYCDIEEWIEYIKEMHLSVKENGVYLNCPVRTSFVHGVLRVNDGDHRIGACVANNVRVPCIISNTPQVDFREFVDYKTKMPVSTGYDEWRGDDERHKVMEQLDWKDKNVVDVGCNTGSACRAAKDLGANRVYGIDYDKDCIYEAAAKGMSFICHDISKGFAIDDDVDFLIMNSIVHWVGSKEFYDSVERMVANGADVLFESHHEDLSNGLYNKIKSICPHRELIGYSIFKKGSARKRGIYVMRGA